MLVVGNSDWERYDARKSAILFCSTNMSVRWRPAASTASSYTTTTHYQVLQYHTDTRHHSFTFYSEAGLVQLCLLMPLGAHKPSIQGP